MSHRRHCYAEGVWRILLLASVACTLAYSQSTPLIDILSPELQRNFETLKTKGELPPYYASYSVTDTSETVISGRFGALFLDRSARVRQLDVSVRVGSPDLDNYHVIDGQNPRFTLGVRIPLEDKADSITPILWRETDRVYRSGIQRLKAIKDRKQQKVEDAEKAADFSQEKPAIGVFATPELVYSHAEWAGRIRKVSEVFTNYPSLLTAAVTVSFQHQVKTMVASDGTKVQHGRNFVRVLLAASTKAPDGMNLSTSETFEGDDPSQLPTEKEMVAAAKRVSEDAVKLVDAPLVTPYVGPAILSGSAAGVFFHEIFGHRIEGERLKDITDGQTFAKSIGKSVLPDFLSVVSDPTRAYVGKVELYGNYRFDDEGIAAAPVTIVDKGILKNFLMSRSPLADFAHSNGHGRRQPGLEPYSRQSNLIVESAKTVPDSDLRKMLIEEIKRQNKPYGYFFQQVTGGFTQTNRAGLGAFKVFPLIVYRVYADGRADQLVRGVDIVGTPLASFAKIVATGDKPEVFNGYCGAESGQVPVSAVAPSILVTDLEVTAQEYTQDRPPILPNPITGGVR